MSGNVHLLISYGRRNRLIRVAIPIPTVRVLLALAIILPLMTTWLVIDRNHRIADQRRLATLTYENNILKGKMGVLRAGVDSLKAEINNLVELDAQLRLANNMPVIPREIREVGIGGGSVGSREPGADVQTSVDWLLDQAKFQRNSFYDIASNLEKQAYLQSSTPSIMPTSGWLSSGFGYRKDPFTGRSTMHPGLDIIGIPGQSIVATASGTVVRAGPYQNWGNVVEIDHGKGLHTFYAHNSSVVVRDGDKVKRGQKIATLGSTGRSTGYHCHYGVTVNGNWVNPQKYILTESSQFD
jgi:murein DD-endopeptidase MepM/ murein hydrolase activator NlpD